MHFIDDLCILRMFIVLIIWSARFFLYIYSINFIMKIQNKNFLASILFVLISFVCEAQIDGTPPPPMPPPPPGLPIDDYVYILVIVAIVYGIYRKIKFSKS